METDDIEIDSKKIQEWSRLSARTKHTDPETGVTVVSWDIVDMDTLEILGRHYEVHNRGAQVLYRVAKTTYKSRTWRQVWTYGLEALDIFTSGTVLMRAGRLHETSDGYRIWHNQTTGGMWTQHSREVKDVAFYKTTAEGG